MSLSHEDLVLPGSTYGCLCPHSRPSLSGVSKGNTLQRLWEPGHWPWYKIPLRTSVQSLNTKSLALALKHCHTSGVNCKTDSQIWASASLNYPLLRNQKLEPSNYLFVVFCPQFSVVTSLVLLFRPNKSQ